MAMRKPRFEIHTGQDGKHYARLKAVNGGILWVTEGYNERRSAAEAVFRLIGIIQAVHYDIHFGYEDDDERK